MLLIIFNFPPIPLLADSGAGDGRYLASRGWAVDVVTRDFAFLEQADPERLKRLDTGIRVFSVPHSELLVYAAPAAQVWPTLRRILPRRKSMRADALSQSDVFAPQGARAIVRAYWAKMEFWRDRLWARDAADLAASVMGNTPYLAIVTSGPPHMAHEAGRLASKKSGIPHVVDMRDPWSLVQRLREEVASPLWVRTARAYEERVVRHASLITMNTQAARDAMRAAYPPEAYKFEVIRNGSDDEPLPRPARDGCFRIRFAGWIYMDRDPRRVFRAIRRATKELGLTPEQFKIELVGHANRYANTPTAQIAEEEGIVDFVSVKGQLPRHQALEFLAGATMLLSLPQDSDYAVPAKIYEYVRFHAWVLVLTKPTSATAEVLRYSDADLVDPSDDDAIARVLIKRYKQFAAG